MEQHASGQNVILLADHDLLELPLESLDCFQPQVIYAEQHEQQDEQQKQQADQQKQQAEQPKEQPKKQQKAGKQGKQAKQQPKQQAEKEKEGEGKTDGADKDDKEKEDKLVIRVESICRDISLQLNYFRFNSPQQGAVG